MRTQGFIILALLFWMMALMALLVVHEHLLYRWHDLYGVNADTQS
jgi:hypothetical protein